MGLPKWLSNFPDGSDGKASAYNVGDLGSIPWLGKSPGEGNSFVDVSGGEVKCDAIKNNVA